MAEEVSLIILKRTKRKCTGPTGVWKIDKIVILPSTQYILVYIISEIKSNIFTGEFSTETSVKDAYFEVYELMEVQ